MKTLNNTIVAFHIGRGGDFYNQGHKSFIGEKEIGDFTDDLFIHYENEREIFTAIKGRTNLEAKFYKAIEDNELNDAAKFFEKLGFTWGERMYFDGGGNPVGLTVAEAETGIGYINIDNDYDSTYTTYLKDCEEKELLLIAKSNEWNANALIEEYFEDKNFDWSKFNGDYVGLIEQSFCGPVDFEEFMKEEVEEE